jgi:hypothetical protein
MEHLHLCENIKPKTRSQLIINTKFLSGRWRQWDFSKGIWTFVLTSECVIFR